MMFPFTYEYELQIGVMNYIRKNGPQSLARLSEDRIKLHPERAPFDSELERVLQKLADENRIHLEEDMYSYNTNYQKSEKSPDAIIEHRWKDNLSGFRFP